MPEQHLVPEGLDLAVAAVGEPPTRLRPLIEPISYVQISNLDEAIYKAKRSVGGGDV